MLPIVHQGIIRNQPPIRRLRRHRFQLRNIYNPFDLPERRFIELYRLNKHLTRRFITILTPHLRSPRLRGGITIESRIFCDLRFYATGTYQRGVGEGTYCSLSQTAVHRAVHEVSTRIVEVMGAEFIAFPQNIRERNVVKMAFMEKWHLPGIIGAIDCTHVALKPPGDEHNFINRKGYHSLNCQVICDHRMKINNIFANYRGSTHDSFIWNHSLMKDYMQEIYESGEQAWLIGDSGYPLQPFLMIPFQNPIENSPESRFNHAHIRARNCIERCFGILKMRFCCLLKERTLRYNPDFVAILLKACAVLHNMCMDENILIYENVGDPDNDNGDVLIAEPLNNQGQLAEEGMRVRDRIVQQYYQYIFYTPISNTTKTATFII